MVILDAGYWEDLTDGEEGRGGGDRRRSDERRWGGRSPEEELLLFHLAQAAARGRRWNTGNGCALRSSAYSGELKPATN